MKHIGFMSCLVDPDVWMRKVTGVNGSHHWEYVLLYVDNAESTWRHEIGTYFSLKEESVGPPDIYFGGA